MKSLDAISGAQRNHEPARSGRCQTAADIDGSLTKAATRFMGGRHGLLSANRRQEPAIPVGRVSSLHATIVNQRVWIFPNGAHGVTRPTLRFLERVLDRPRAF